MIRIYSSDVNFFYYFFRSLETIFQKYGIPYVYVTDIGELSPNRRNNDDLYIFSFDFFCKAHPLDPNFEMYVPAKFIYYHSEPCIDGKKDVRFFSTDYINTILPRALEVWNYSMANNKQFNSVRINSVWFPLSYTPFLEAKVDATDKQYDVLLYGVIHARRQKIIDGLKAKNINVQVPSSYHTYGEALDLLISQSRVVLAMFYYEPPVCQPFDFARLAPVISKKAVIVAEKSFDEELNNIFADKITICSYDQLVDSCVQILAHYDQYQQRAAETYQWYKTTYNMETYLDLSTLSLYAESKPAALCC